MNYRTAQTAIAVARLEFVGLPFADFGMAQAVAALRLASQGAEWRYVVTPNAANLARWSSADPVLLDCYRNADFCFLDSRVISLASRLVGLRPPQVIPGSDLVEQLFQHAITPETTICIVGGGHDVMRTLRKRFGVGVISHVNPSFGFWRHNDEVERTAAFIVASKADFTFLVVGSPGQEMLATRVATMAGARGVALCAGASIDFITGVQRRAPRFMQHMALEWAYRLYMEPRRLAYRYFIESPRGVLLVLRTRLRN